MRLLFILSMLVMSSPKAWSFCGFFVAKADSKLFNKASQVVLVRNEEKTVLTMANDYQGDPKDFALVIPVPTVLEKEQIHVGEKALIDHLDAFTAPRLVEYYDNDPCAPPMPMMKAMTAEMAGAGASDSATASARSLGVTIEAQYTVGEYDILILSAKESSGLISWLNQEKYKVPPGAAPIIKSYLNQGMKFFVAKVNIKEQSKMGYTYLRPLQMAFDSPKFMLPIRLGTVNADGPQDLIIYTLTQKGRVETTNYRTVPLPTGMEIPVYVKNEFPDFYKSMFAEQVKREDMKVVFLEYAWDMGWCDPCAADPLSPDELKKLGVFWLSSADSPAPVPLPGIRSGKLRPMPMPIRPGPVSTFVTRLHVRYNAVNFPEDLVFQETSNRDNFQGRFVLRHPFTGEVKCEQGKRYQEGVVSRQNEEAKVLAQLTGWDINSIRKKMSLKGEPPAPKKWWQNLWK